MALSSPPRYHSSSIGIATNYLAELHGIKNALQHLLQTNPLPNCVHIFVDNQAAIKVSVGTWSPKQHVTLVQEIRKLLKALNNRTVATLHWVPGHVLVPGNEQADFLAKRGARAQGPPSNSPIPRDDLTKINSRTKKQWQPQSRSKPTLPRPRKRKTRNSRSLPVEQPTRKSTRKRKQPAGTSTLFPGIDFRNCD